MISRKIICLNAIATVTFLLTQPVFAAKSDEEKLMRKSGCFRCHAVDKEKKGPPYSEIAEKYRGKDTFEGENVMDKLYTHVTTEPMVEVEGKEKKHKKLKTDDKDTVNSVIKWILAH